MGGADAIAAFALLVDVVGWLVENPASGFRIRQLPAGVYSTLTSSETEALNRIRTEGNMRLEQERVPWAFALEVLVAAAALT